jgi:hypothetical protein
VLVIDGALACGDLVEARRFASIRTWEYRESMARETCPAMLMRNRFHAAAFTWRSGAR